MLNSRLDYCNSIATLRATGQTDWRYAGRESSMAQLDLSCGNLSKSIVLFHCWKNCTGFRWNSEYRILTFAYRHFEGSLPSYRYCPRLSASISRLVVCDRLRKSFSKSPEPSWNFWSAFMYILGPLVSAARCWSDVRNAASLACFWSQLETHLSHPARCWRGA